MKRWLIASTALTVLAAAAALLVGLVWPDVLRERIPIHWDVHMQPNDWSTRADYYKILLIAPAVMALMTLLTWLLPMISPKQFEVEPFARTFGFAMTVVVGYFAYMQALLIWVGIEDSPLWPKFFIAGIFLLFACLGNVMGKVQRNFWMGVRTPWTLASEVVWDRTHRLAAWLWFTAGLLGALLVILGVPFWLAFVLLMATVFWPVLYSLWLYKRLQREGKV